MNNIMDLSRSAPKEGFFDILRGCQRKKKSCLSSVSKKVDQMKVAEKPCCPPKPRKVRTCAPRKSRSRSCSKRRRPRSTSCKKKVRRPRSASCSKRKPRSRSRCKPKKRSCSRPKSKSRSRSRCKVRKPKKRSCSRPKAKPRSRSRCKVKRRPRSCSKPRKPSCKRKRCMKPGPVTNNGYLNFLRWFRKQCCGLTPKETIVEGAKAWCALTKEQKDKFNQMACKVTVSPRRKKTPLCRKRKKCS